SNPRDVDGRNIGDAVLRTGYVQPRQSFAALFPHQARYAGAALLSRSRISLPVLKNGTDFCATETCAPVRGLRPVRAGRFFTEKAPKPRNSTRSPRAIAATT